MKKVSTSTERKRICEAGLYGKIAIKNTVEEVKQCQKAPVDQDAQRQDNKTGIKTFGLTNHCSKFWGQIEGSIYIYIYIYYTSYDKYENFVTTYIEAAAEYITK